MSRGLGNVYLQVFESMGLPAEDQAGFVLRTQLLLELKGEFKKRKWNQRQAAEALNVAQPRISEIMTLRIDKFSVELLLKYLDRLGKQASFVVKKKPPLE